MRQNFNEEELQRLLANRGRVRGSTDARRTTVSNGSSCKAAIQQTKSQRGELAPSPTIMQFFLVEGTAMGKQRPCVLRYRAWCDLVRESAGWDRKHTLSCPVKMTVRIFLLIPPSWSTMRQQIMIGEPHTSKPDIDNIAKGIMDALFTNDSCVYKLEAEKYWTESNPHVAVTIEEVQP
jgi:Holliday junction resolvase RusA-like endonuclease